MKIALIDADFLPYYVCHNKKTEEPKTFEQCCQKADEFINNLLNRTSATHYIMAWTVGKTCFRYKINPKYKANRKYKDVIPFLKETKEYIMKKYHSVVHEDLEADDIVNIIYNKIENSFIISPDKDILRLEGHHFNPREMEWTNFIGESRHFWTTMITGDSIDGVPGIPGKGKKFAEKLFESETLDNKEVTNTTSSDSLKVFECYVNNLGIDNGIEEFYKNYKCLKIVKDWPSFLLPTLMEVSYISSF